MVDFPASYVSLPEAMRRQKISQDAAAATSHNIVFFFLGSGGCFFVSPKHIFSWRSFGFVYLSCFFNGLYHGKLLSNHHLGEYVLFFSNHQTVANVSFHGGWGSSTGQPSPVTTPLRNKGLLIRA